MRMNRIVAAFEAAGWESVGKERTARDRGSRELSSFTTARNERKFGMKRYMNHTATIGMLGLLIGVGTGAPEAFAGVGVCTICDGCPDGMTVCFPGGTPVSACTDIGCAGGTDTSTECFGTPACPATEAGQCDDGVNNDAYQNGDTDCADAACAGDPACIIGACCNINEACAVISAASCSFGEFTTHHPGEDCSVCGFADSQACCYSELAEKKFFGVPVNCVLSSLDSCAEGFVGVPQGTGTFCTEENECVTPPVPTVSEWGLAAMTLLILAAGTLVVAKRRRHVAA